MKIKRIKNTTDLQFIDFRYDEGIRGRTDSDIVPTLTTRGSGNSSSPMCGYIYIYNGECYMQVRRLTALECYKAMGFEQKDYDKVKYQTDTTTYHQAGDSICTTVLCAIFGKLFDLDYETIINDYVDSLKGDYDEKN